MTLSAMGTSDHEIHNSGMLQVFVYLASLQLLWSSPRSTAPACITGLLFGAAYWVAPLGLQRLKVQPVGHRLTHLALATTCCFHRIDVANVHQAQKANWYADSFCHGTLAARCS